MTELEFGWWAGWQRAAPGHALERGGSHREGRACPLYVPDPRWMALHKLWLAKEPEIGPAKKPKDQRQGEVLLDATRFFLSDSHPLNIDFVLSLPEELQPHFNAWCESRHFVPQDELGLLAS